MNPSKDMMSFEQWAEARIQSLLHEVRMLQAVLQQYKLAGNSTESASLLHRFQNAMGSAGAGGGSAVEDLFVPSSMGLSRPSVHIAALDDRKTAQSSKYDAMLGEWAKTPDLGLNNAEIYQLAQKTVPGCGTKNAVLTYIWGLERRGMVKKQGGRVFLVRK
jgi:hypothetical protein